MKSLKQIIKETIDSLDWMDNIPEAPNVEGKPQGVVYLSSYDEIDEFVDIIYGSGSGFIMGDYVKNRDEIKHLLHFVLDETLDRLRGEYTDWTPQISAEFFVSRKNPKYYDFGYWDSDVNESDVQTWLDEYGCKEEVIDCENWKIYDNVSQVRQLF